MNDLPPAGWYRNPAGPGQRYWDGQAWTEHFHGQEAHASKAGGVGTEAEPRDRSVGQTIKGSKALIGIGIVVAGLVILVIVAAVVGTDNSDEVDSLKSQLADSQQALSDRNGDVDRIYARNQQLRKQLGPVADLDSKIKDLEQQKSGLESQVSDLQSQVQAEQSKLQTTKETVAKSTISDGTWESGVDYVPGVYTTDGGGGCYWEKLKSPQGGGLGNIIDNGGFEGHITLTIDSPWFHSERCGTWHKSG